jgi:hypothetical protein
MVVQAVSPKPGVAGGTGDTRQLDAQRRGRTCLHAAPNPEPPHLQAVHAGKHGVIIKGTHHETFWEWRV